MHWTRLTLFLITLTIFISCTSQNSNIIVAEYGNYKIYMDEFENAYAKNSGGYDKSKNDSLSSYQKFLDLYVNYKMKLRDAEVRGYKSDSDMQKELRDYKTNIGSTLYLNNKLYEPGLNQLYERRKTEYRASHIYLTPDSSMNDATVQELGKNLIKRIQNGEDFAALAKQYSKDSYSKESGGDVYYFTTGTVNNADIEDAVYKTEPGNIYPELISSGSGFHIIKITEKHPRKAAISVGHILITFSDSTEKADTAKALKTIQEIEQKIKNGADFGEMALKYSKDKGSASRHGVIGMITRGQTVREFDDVAFKLKKGEISPIVKTQFGFHLIRMIGEGDNQTYDQEKDALREMYQRIRYKSDYDKLVEKLKNEFKFVQTGDTFARILTVTDTLKINQDYWESNVRKVIGSGELFNLNGKSYPCDSLFSFMIDRSINLNNRLNSKILQDAISQYAGDVLVREKALTYDQENSEFEKLLKDYENGMYLFKILEDEVWSKIAVDSAKVYDFWNQTKQNYKWKDRVEFKEIYCQTDSLINKCYLLATSGTNYDTLFVRYNQRTGYEKTPGYSGLVDTDFSELTKQADALKNIGDISKPFKFDNGWSIVKLIKRDNARLKTYDEAKAETASQFQEKESKRFEDEYLNKLRNLYHPKLNYEELNKAFKH